MSHSSSSSADGVDNAYFDTSVTFQSLGLDARVFKSIAKQGFVYPTQIQSQCIPVGLEGKDVLARARTGSGKTLAYGVCVVQNVLSALDAGEGKDSVKAVIIVPTRELCDQVRDQLRALMHFCADTLKLVSLGGGEDSGVSVDVQAVHLRDLRPDIVVATPGRLVEHLRKGHLTLRDSLRMLVVDEADMVLSFGYDEDVNELLTYLPKLYQTLLMSATLSPEVEELQKVILNNPVVLELDDTSSKMAGQLTQFYLRISASDKFLLAYAFLKLNIIRGKTVFFVNTVDRGFRLKIFLERFSIQSAVLNAELPFNSRYNIMQQFNRGVFDYLIATDESLLEDNDDDADDDNGGADNKSGGEDDDVEDTKQSSRKQKKQEQKLRESRKRKRDYGVARGIDFHDVSTVVNFDFPRTVKSYVHRIGRTARGGANGTALSLVSSDEVARLDTVLEATRKRQFGNNNDNDDSDDETKQQGEEQQEEQSDVVQAMVNATPLQLLQFRREDVEGFRYRVEDVLRSVTRAVVREARLKEIRMEMVNSTKLRAHFEDNPHELDLLKHAKVLQPHRVQKHLQEVPSYLLPDSVKSGVLDQSVSSQLRHGGRAAKRRRKNNSRNAPAAFSGVAARRNKDPLKSLRSSGGGRGRRGGGRGGRRRRRR
eukprot:TRINITY_DN65733_c8_g1_i1.p1 TRINITY_DN65733_c8_g1~~TRINITY_DN65733_c8_g1_i1.p1  ORF type:complete len:672 (-),score=369.09 TRINITY_DN65733_c8_g1_i1:1827-3785(-)